MRIAKLTVTAAAIAAAVLTPTFGAIAGQADHDHATVSASAAGGSDDGGSGEDDDTPWG